MPGIWSDIVDAFSPGGVRGQQHQRFEEQQQERQEQYRAQKADEEHMKIMDAYGALPIHAGMVQRPTFDPGVMLGTSPTGDLPAGVPGAQTTIPPSNGTYLDKADMSRASKWKDAFGDLIQHEVPTPEEQQQRKAYLDYASTMNPARQQAQRVQDQEQAARASSVAEGTAAGAETGRQASLNTARQQYGTALPEGSGVGAGQKFLPEELPGVVAGVTQATGLPAQLQQAKIARASQALGSVSTPGAYQIIYNGIRDPQIQSLFDAPADFDPIKSPTRARMVNMKPEDQQKTSQMLTMSPGDWQAQTDAAYPITGANAAEKSATGAQNKSARMLVDSYVRQGEFDKARAIIEKGNEQQGKTITGVATAHATEPVKIQIAGAEAAARGAGQMAASGTTEDDYRRAGEQYAISGVMPPMGMGSAARGKIMHYAQDFARQSGMTPRDMAVAQAAFAGDSRSLKAFQSQRDQIVSFENTAQKNLDLFLDAASKIPDTGSPWVNAPLRTLDANAVGSANMAAVNAARQVANNEIAKVTAGGGLSGVLSDAARNEVKSYNPENATFKQTVAVANIMKRDMANRHAAMDAMIGEIKNRIGAPAGGTAAPAATGTTTFKYYGVGPNGHKIGSNGGPWVEVPAQ